MRLKRLLRSLLGVDEENKVLKARITCQESRFTSLVAYTVAAVKEMRQHAEHKTCAEELADELAEFESRGSLDGWVNLNEDDEEEAMRHLSLKVLEGQWDDEDEVGDGAFDWDDADGKEEEEAADFVDELDEEPYVHVWPCKRECCG